MESFLGAVCLEIIDLQLNLELLTSTLDARVHVIDSPSGASRYWALALHSLLNPLFLARYKP